MKKFFLITTSLFTFIILLITAFILKTYYQTHTIDPTQKPRILFTNFHPTGSGGHFTYILSILKSRLNENFDFAVAVPPTSDIYEKCIALGIQTYPCDFNTRITDITDYRKICEDCKKIFDNSKTIRTILKEFKPDIIHSNGGKDSKLMVWNAFLAGQKPLFIRTYHGTKIFNKDPYHRFFVNNLIDANLFISTAAFKLNEDQNGLQAKNSYIIENAVDLERFYPIPKDDTLKEQLGIPKNYFVFGSNAGLSDYKRFDLMLETLTRFPSDAPFRVIALGRNPDPWIQKAKAMGVDQFIIFPGYHEDVRPFCSLFDIGFILSTRVETSSFASREMLAMGIPLISSAYSGLKDNIDPYSNGILVEPNNVQEIYNAMSFCLNLPPSEFETYKKNARLKTEQCFDSKNQINALEQLYYQLLTKRKSKSPNQQQLSLKP